MQKKHKTQPLLIRVRPIYLYSSLISIHVYFLWGKNRKNDVKTAIEHEY